MKISERHCSGSNSYFFGEVLMMLRTAGVWILCGAFVFCLAKPISAADDWPQWRGPGRDGRIASGSAPSEWPAKLTRKWKIKVGAGHASPIVADGKVYLISRQEDREIVRCANLADGRPIWEKDYPAPYKMHPPAVPHGKGPKSTPIVADGRLFTYGISGILSCFDAKSGQPKWRKEFSKQFQTTSPLCGTTMSPLVHRGMVIIHVGGHDKGELRAFDAVTGDQKWSWGSDGPGYASPILLKLGGTEQIVTLTQIAVIGVSASTGELLWRIPYETDYIMNIVTPVVYKTTLIVSGYNRGTTAFRISKQGAKWVPTQIWHQDDIPQYMSSPVISGDLMFGMSQRRKGQLFCADPATGKLNWTNNGRMGDNAAFIVAGNAILMLTTNADLYVFKNEKKALKITAQYKVADSATWAHPVLVGKSLLTKDVETLSCWHVQ
jgi:outer membrane protein assembly factor BamB